VTCIVPPKGSPGSVLVSIDVYGTSSAESVSFLYVAAVEVYSITPSVVPAGSASMITLKGRSFSNGIGIWCRIGSEGLNSSLAILSDSVAVALIDMRGMYGNQSLFCGSDGLNFSFVTDLKDYPNLVVLQTLSKAWGLAALRIGMAFASEEIIGYLNKVKPPYNISEPVQQLSLQALDEIGQVNDMIVILVAERSKLEQSLASMTEVKKVHPSDANFLLVEFNDAKKMYEHLVECGIVVRDRSTVVLCEHCLRITVGTAHENSILLKAIEGFKP
jgi:hypothetical protein